MDSRRSPLITGVWAEQVEPTKRHTIHLFFICSSVGKLSDDVRDQD
jgi:hypothetical protein